MTGFLLIRLRAYRLLTAAALLTVVLTTCALAALGAFSGSVGDAGLRRALEHRSVDRTLFEVESSVTARNKGALDTTVREAAAGAFGGLPARIASSTRSGPYALPAGTRRETATRGASARADGDPDLTLLATFDSSRVTLVDGERPGAPTGRGPVPVALPETAARALDVRSGDIITLTDRLHGPSLKVRLTGVYRPTDRGDPYWKLDPLEGRGAGHSGFTTYGPLLTAPMAFTSGRVAPHVMAWQARADFTTMTTDRIDGLRASLHRAAERIDDGTAGEAQASTELPELLSEIRRPLLVSRSALLAGALQLAALAGFALLLVAHLLTGERAGETSVLRARGASRVQLAALAVAEALLLTVPAAVVAVPAAGPLVRLLASHGALARAGVRFPEQADSAAWWAAAATAVACALAMAAPALRRPGTYTGDQAARSRPAVHAAVRAGGDLALLLLAMVGYWQLSRRAEGGGMLSTDSTGVLGVAPVLVAVPCLCLLAGAVTAHRLLPAVSRLAQWWAERSRRLGPALAGWQLSRRPGRVAGPLLLLVLTVGTSTLALGQGASWDRSQRDQAGHTAGADIRVTGAFIPQFGQGGVFEDLPGVDAAAPAARTHLSLSQDRRATVLATDTTRSARLMHLRRDQSGPAPAALLEPLRPAARPDTGFVLPDGARQLLITVRLEAAGADPDRGAALKSLAAVVHDRYGVPYTFTLDDLPADGLPHELTLDLAAAAGSGGEPAGPLRLTELSASYRLPAEPTRQTLTITGLRATGADGTARPVRTPTEAAGWTAAARPQDPDFQESPADGLRAPRAKQPVPGERGDVLAVPYDSGSDPTDPVWFGHGSALLTLRATASAPPVLAAVATDAFLRATGTKVGGITTIDLAGAAVPVRITGSLRSLPTTPASGGGALLLDLRSVNHYLTAHAAPGLQPDEWWLGTGPADAPRVAAALRSLPGEVTFVSHEETVRDLSADPFGAGPRTALQATALVAGALAAAAFAALTAGALRERTDEFAVLRALGVPRRRIMRAVLAEQGVLVLAGVTAGMAIGALLTRLLVPLTVLTARAGLPTPRVVVEPPSTTALLILVLCPLLVLPALTALAVRSRDIASVLRRGAV